MIHLTDVTLKRGQKTLFSGLDLTVHAGHRAGIVGRNGVGKSTLFLLLRGRLVPEEGEVRVPRSWTIAHLDQETEPSPASALEWTIDGDRPLGAVRRRIEAAEAGDDQRRLPALYAELEAMDGYTAETRAGRILHGLGFEPGDLTRPVSDFSGGWRIRLNLAQTLMCRSDLLLLDEPTNHLDLDAVVWLEQWLTRRAGTTLLVSHDRDFLDRTATDIVHLEDGRARAYRGGYSSFEVQRSERLALERSTFEKQQRRAREIRAFVTRFGAKATKARQARSRMKELERLALVAPAHADSSYRFSFPSPERVSNPLLRIEEASLGYAGSAVLAGVNLTLQPGARIGLLGRNGAGKSTLMRAVAGELGFLAGSCERGRNAPVGYFAQHTMETLEPAKNPMEHLLAADPTATDQAARNFLGGWGFSGDAAFTRSAFLSGGEKARLALALIAWRKPAVLLLDEPTNHLDLDMRHALTVALQSYDGALVIVSHDRHLLGNTVDELLLVADGGVDPYDGTLDEYRDWLLGRDDPGPSVGPAAVRGAAAARRRAGAKARARLKPLRDELRGIEERLAALQSKLDSITVVLADADAYRRLSGEEVTALIARHKRYRARVESLEEEWMSVSERLDAATAA
ncbi:MAG: ATP-binding cassette domain-containing protein [Immundisolibacterales bacterium]|nr:ATP-binding cassette domain-containing protein [Immundisolibacterales bacterium]